MKRTRRERFLIGVRKAKKLSDILAHTLGDGKQWPAGRGGEARALGKFRKTRKSCSCVLCGNPRKYFGEGTLQERRREERDRGEAFN